MASSTIPIIIMIASFVIYLVFNSINERLGAFFLIVFFLFAVPNIDAIQGLFYGLTLVAVMIFAPFSRLKTNRESVTIGKKRITGVLPQLGFVILGIGIWLIMRSLQVQSPAAAIIGVPQLAIVGNLPETLKMLFAPTIIGLLGIIENLFFFTLYLILTTEAFGRFFSAIGAVSAKIPAVGRMIGVFFTSIGSGLLNKIFAGITTAVLFSLFHLSVYGLVLGALVFAVLVMSLWIISFEVFRDTTPADTSHWMWNGLIQLGRSFSIT